MNVCMCMCVHAYMNACMCIHVLLYIIVCSYNLVRVSPGFRTTFVGSETRRFVSVL